METSDWIILICLILSAFFSGMEIAYISANRIFLEIEKNKKNLFASLLQWVTQTPQDLLRQCSLEITSPLLFTEFLWGTK